MNGDGKKRILEKEEQKIVRWGGREDGRDGNIGKEEGDERLGWKMDEMIEEWKSIVYNNRIEDYNNII